MLTIILVVLLVLFLLGYGGYGRSRWGFGVPGDIIGLLLVILVIYLIVRMVGAL